MGTLATLQAHSEISDAVFTAGFLDPEVVTSHFQNIVTTDNGKPLIHGQPIGAAVTAFAKARPHLLSTKAVPVTADTAIDIAAIYAARKAGQHG